MTAEERHRLARILGMLGSEHEGERTSAALQAEAFRKRHGLTWADLLALPPVEVIEVTPEPDAATAAQQAKWAAEDAARKAAWKAAQTPPKPPPPHKRPAARQSTSRWKREDIPMHLFTLAVLIGTPVLLRYFFG